jgi:hypothetical protein
LNVAKPCRVAVRLYLPGASAATEKKPSAFVTAVRFDPVAKLPTVIETSGSAAWLSSRTAPVSVAVAACASTPAGTASVIVETARSPSRARMLRYVPMRILID